MKRVYLDNAATTPTASEVVEAMEPYFNENFGNPSSIYSFGREAKNTVEDAREKVAQLIGADDAAEIVFTSGGTEADNLAIKGVAMKNKEQGNHIITSAVEHHAVLHTCEYLEEYHDFEVTYLPVDENGLVNPIDVAEAITDDTILISIMLANNEVGSIQPIAEIGQIAQKNDIYFHTDAVQAVGSIPVDVNELNADLLALSGHKFNGPKGIGALYIRKGTQLTSFMHGGAQERGRRASTENVPAIVGLGKAAEIALEELDEKREKMIKLRDKLINGIKAEIDEVILNGHPTKRLPNNVNFSIRYIEGESLLLNLDLEDIAASSGSACTSGSLDPSHVLLAMGLSHEVAHGSLRLSLGKYNTEEDVDYVLEKLPAIVDKLRAMSPIYNQK
ncbi:MULTISPECIES: cysteine desulfurase NifS [unclassified Candidatus Frackibacter]|uniref:cysteine desulfurase NifS n=1 Tax=unclassified Candidatus Frackibacter TaxID=2648818 RepID=UPI0008862115|nr:MULTISPECIES: cysteine desulfurase NifS [unclassified Candidatus Frackibacter]SDC64847.1 cysteine desulfurase [Candidatus Frackibacter sp. WG11]SEM77188.1 cysteine desulfurase [Candidatus Frackibacter sp. WG12]SFL88917.1 cysteine desulfurase [Candidatus Frackibacter sp. WG13]